MKYLPDSILMRRVTNATVSGGSAGEAVNIARVQVGDRGNAVTELKPNGKAMIHGEICEVFSRQGILIKGYPCARRGHPAIRPRRRQGRLPSGD